MSREIERIFEIWRSCRERHGDRGRFLFGEYCLADAIYAPVVTRFDTYKVALDDRCSEYAAAVRKHPHVAEWIAGAREESWVEPEFDL